MCFQSLLGVCENLSEYVEYVWNIIFATRNLNKRCLLWIFKNLQKFFKEYLMQIFVQFLYIKSLNLKFILFL